MLPALTVLAASYVAFAAHSTQISGQPPARLCSPADARTHAAARPPCMLAKVEADALIDEINHEHQEELRAVAWKKGTEDGVDWTTEELSAVELVAVDEEGIHIEEVLCSSTDQRCIAVDLPIPWPQGMQLSQLAEMRAAFNDLVRKAYSSVGIEDIPPEYQMQQQELDSLMSLMNAEFGRCVRERAHLLAQLSPLTLPRPLLVSSGFSNSTR